MKYLISAITTAATILLGELLIYLLFPARPLTMSFSVIPVIIWFIIGGLIATITGRLNLTLVLTIIGFYLIGNLNAVASYFHYGSHYLTDLQTTNQIYTIYSLVFTASVSFFESKFAKQTPVAYNELRKESLDTIFYIGACLFPVIWILDELLVLGRIPILSGQSITEDIYATQYGKLYGYGILLGISALLMWSKLRQTQLLGRCVLLLGLSIALFAMIFDGRRVFLMAFLGAIFAFEITGFPNRKIWKPVLQFILVLLGLYIFILYARQGGRLITYLDPSDIFSKVGVEYRDFSYIVTHLSPGALTAYSWLGSAIGGFGNWLLLALIGLDKNELVFSGSAYQLGIFYKSATGIRVGLFAEIWLQYGIIGAIFCIPVAALYTWFGSLVQYSKSEVARVLASMAFGVALLSFLGQASAITGYWSLIIYLTLLWMFLERYRRPHLKSENPNKSK